ncbi:hypothetical protein [Butyrivibrio sp. AC2005]|uniref:hypothetical protein n=1 Tax=Butyrivibrio sp. AC2005 TaxID=1280672 RepID=UPI000426C2F1|nr:hypothetical protein [Butyrivibrio sp. AC2005]
MNRFNEQVQRKNRYFSFKGLDNYNDNELSDIQKCQAVINLAYNEIKESECISVGIEVLGPLITGYSIWLRQLLCIENVDALFFLSREGDALKSVYDTLYGKNDDNSYLHISRISMIRGCMKLLSSADQFMRLISGLLNNISTISGVCELLGLSQNEIDKIEKDFGLRGELDVHSLVEYNTLYEAILTVGDETLTKQYSITKDYFRQRGILDGKRVMIADIGWAGTMQCLLQLMFPDVVFIGAYLAVNDFHNETTYKNLKRYGYICDSETWHLNGQEIRFTTLALESLLQNSEGTTLGYEDINGKVEVVTEERPDKERIEPVVDELRDGYIAFAKAYQIYKIDGEYEKVNPNVSKIGYVEFAVSPKMSTVEFFDKYKNLSLMIDSNITAAHSLVYYFFHPKSFYKELDISNAKIIWLKSVFKLPLPYYIILCFLVNKVHLKSKRQKFNESV